MKESNMDLVHTSRENRLSLTHLSLMHLWDIYNNKKINIETVGNRFHARIRPAATRILEGFQNSRHPAQLFHILQILDEKKLIRNPLILRAAESISNHYLDRLRDLECFSVSTQNTRQQYKMLIQHLFSNYPVPAFMDDVWFDRDQSNYQKWFKHIGGGGNLRTAPELPPIEITKKIAHYFCEAPAHFRVEEALRVAQLYALGGNGQLAGAIRRTRLVSPEAFTEDTEGFWTCLLRFLTAHFSQLDEKLLNKHINLIVDYVWNIKFAPGGKILIAGGGERPAAPRQPRFRLNGKSLKSLLDDAEAWHDGPPDDRVVGFEWHPAKDIEPFRFVQGKKIVWEIKELLSSAALIEEGKALSHCIGSSEYIEACYDGQSSIWSLGRSAGNGSFEKLLTIEVEIADENENRIVEIRGKDNRLPREEDELTIIKFWSLLHDLDVDT